jgi:hypothetical protein
MLAIPLFACGGKRELEYKYNKLNIFFPDPLSGEAEERVVQRSVDRVSQLYAKQSHLFMGYSSFPKSEWGAAMANDSAL